MTPDQYIDTALKDLADVYGGARVLAHARVMFEPALPSSPSRASDPDTSHASGNPRATRDVRRFSAGSLPGKLLAWFEAVGIGGYTALEVAVNLTQNGSLHRVESARKRVSELAAAGYVADSGERRANPGSDEQAVVWRITAEGSAAYAAMKRTGWTRAAA
jgi:hypothetical protein